MDASLLEPRDDHGGDRCHDSGGMLLLTVEDSYVWTRTGDDQSDMKGLKEPDFYPPEFVVGEGAIGTTVGASQLVKSISPCLLYTSPSPRDRQKSRMPSSA